MRVVAATWGVALVLASAGAVARDVPEAASIAGEEARYAARRTAMVRAVASSGYPFSDTVLKALAAVPRHLYVPKVDRDEGYENRNMGIGWGQTITNPFMVAKMTELLRLKDGDKVLEIGTGSGYHASVMAQVTPNVYTIEIVKPLAERTHEVLRSLGLDPRVRHAIGDGYYGWKENAPYDRIVVTCGADHIPLPLIQQLKPGGIMIIPVGPPFQRQKVYMVEKTDTGEVKKKVVGTGDFVRLTRSPSGE
jgi:protein-L-isoaspartate(D-aspartate) O-methyltransferase